MPRLKKTQYQRPILSTAVDDRITDAVQSCEHRGKWAAWGMDKVREQGVAILLHGPPGCLAGNTRLFCKRGNRHSARETTLMHLYNAFNGWSSGKSRRPIKGDAFLHSYDSEEQIVRYNRIVSVLKSGRKDIYRLTTTQGIVDGTIDHPILIQDGTFVELGRLVEGDSLLTKGSMLSLSTAKVLGIDKLGEKMTYDVQMESPANNFTVNDGLIVHNTGKTMTGHYIAKRLHLAVVEVSIADYGTQVPGQLARNIKQLFNGELIIASQEKRQPGVILLDECDSMLVDRRKLGSEMMWMLEPINALLHHIGRYPGIVVLATNMAELLDPALERRLIAKIYIGRPDEVTRRKIWKAKWPEKFPVQPTAGELDILAMNDLTGAQIENALIIWVGKLLRLGIEEPLVYSLQDFIATEFMDYYKDGNHLELEYANSYNSRS